MSGKIQAIKTKWLKGINKNLKIAINWGTIACPEPWHVIRTSFDPFMWQFLFDVLTTTITMYLNTSHKKKGFLCAECSVLKRYAHTT